MATSSARTIYALNGPQACGEPASADTAEPCAEAGAQFGRDIPAGDNFSYHSPAAKTNRASLTSYGLEGYRHAIGGLAARISATATA